MRVHVVADVHGNVDDLARAADGADLFLVLGDLLDYVDYHEPSRGILGGIFGAERVRRFTALRSRGDFPALHAYNVSLWSSLHDPHAVIAEIVAERYAQVIEVLPADSLLLLGNVDVLAQWTAQAPASLQPLDGVTRSIGGLTFGFVGGGSGRPGVRLRASTSPWQPYVRSAEEFEASVAALGRVDVLCSHVPPKITGMRYDTVPARLEMYGAGLLEHIDAFQPAYALSGHVHQPLTQRTRRGRTECINVGHFQRRGRPFVLEL